MFYLRDGMVFVDLGDDYLLCIATQEEFQKATPEQVAEMIQEAIAINQYKCVEIWNKPVH